MSSRLFEWTFSLLCPCIPWQVAWPTGPGGSHSCLTQMRAAGCNAGLPIATHPCVAALSFHIACWVEVPKTIQAEPAGPLKAGQQNSHGFMTFYLLCDEKDSRDLIGRVEEQHHIEMRCGLREVNSVETYFTDALPSEMKLVRDSKSLLQFIFF